MRRSTAKTPPRNPDGDTLVLRGMECVARKSPNITIRMYERDIQRAREQANVKRPVRDRD
jgi:endonuclease YncB( thermonuclease family)